MQIGKIMSQGDGSKKEKYIGVESQGGVINWVGCNKEYLI